MTRPQPAAEASKPFLPARLYFANVKPRQLYVGGFLVGFALSAAVGAALYAFL